MIHQLSLDHLTVATVGPLELLEIAQACGCAAVNLRMEPAPYLPVPWYDVIGDPGMRAAIRAKAEQTGVAIRTVDPFVLREETTLDRLRPFVDAAADIGAKAINTVCYDPDNQRLVDNLAALAELATASGLGTRVELFAFSAINTLAKAVALLTATGRSDITLNADILHLTRTGASMAELARVPRDMIGYAQICDGPATMPVDEQMAEATLNRLVPGEGAFDLIGFINALPENITIGIEAPSGVLTEQGLTPLEKARRIVDATRKVQREAAKA